MVAGRPVDFTDESPDSLHQLTFFDLFPVGVSGEICFSLAHQIEPLKQRVDPTLVTASLIQFASPRSADFVANLLPTHNRPPLEVSQGDFADILAPPDSKEGPLTI